MILILMNIDPVTQGKMLRGKSLISALAVLIFAANAIPATAQNHNSKGKEWTPDEKVYEPLSKAPRKAAERPNPLANDPDAVAAGANLFDQHCAECHGELAEGTREGPSLRVDQVQQATPGILFWILTNGVVRRGMPVWSKLPEPQRWQLVSYLKSLNSAQVPTQTAH